MCGPQRAIGVGSGRWGKESKKDAGAGKDSERRFLMD